MSLRINIPEIPNKVGDIGQWIILAKGPIQDQREHSKDSQEYDLISNIFISLYEDIIEHKFQEENNSCVFKGIQCLEFKYETCEMVIHPVDGYWDTWIYGKTLEMANGHLHPFFVSLRNKYPFIGFNPTPTKGYYIYIDKQKKRELLLDDLLDEKKEN